MPLDHNMSDSTRGAIKVLTSIEVPKASLATLGRGSEVYAALEKRVKVLDDLFDLSRVHARRHFNGNTARNYEHSLDQFTTGDNDYVGSARSNAATMSSELFKARANVEYMHMMVIGQFVQLLAEIAWAIATAKFTFGASLKWIPIFKAIRSLAIRRILTWLLITVPGHQIISQIFASMDSIIQRIQIGRGTRHHKDPNLTRSAHIGATIEGALSAVFSAGMDGLFSKQLTDLFNDRVARITDLPDPPPLVRTEPTPGPGGPPTGPPIRETPDGPPSGPPTGPPPDPRGPVKDTPPPGNPNRDTDTPPPPGGGPDGPPSGPVKDDPPATNPDRGPDSPAPKGTPGADLPAPSLNKDLAEVFVRHKDEFLVPYNPASPIGAGVFDNAAKAAAARNEFADLFARHFGDHIGDAAARDLGRDYADTLARNWTDPNLAQHLRDTIGDRLPPTTRDHLSDVPVTLQQPLNDYFSKASTYAQQTGGSIGTGALEGYLGEGLGSMADGRGWEASVWSATSGATQAGIQQGATDGILHGADLFKDKDKPDLNTPPPQTESNGSDNRTDDRTDPGETDPWWRGDDDPGQNGDRTPERNSGNSPAPGDRSQPTDDRDGEPAPPSRDDEQSLYDSDSDSDTSSVFDRDENPSPYDSDDEASLFDTDEATPQQDTTTEKPNGKPGPDTPHIPGPRDVPLGTNSPDPRTGDAPFPQGMNNGPLAADFLNAIVPDNPMAAAPPDTEQTTPNTGNTDDRDTADPTDRSAHGPEQQHGTAPVAVAPPVGQAAPPPAPAPQNPAPDTGQRPASSERGGGRPSQGTGDTRAQDPSTRQTTDNGPQVATESAPPAMETVTTGDTTGQDDQVTSTDEQRANPHTAPAPDAPSPADVPLPPPLVTESGPPQDTEDTGHTPSERDGGRPDDREEDTSRDDDRSQDRDKDQSGGSDDRSGDGQRSGEESGDRSGDGREGSGEGRDRSGDERGDGSDGEKDRDGERADDDTESVHEEESTDAEDGQERGDSDERSPQRTNDDSTPDSSPQRSIGDGAHTAESTSQPDTAPTAEQRTTPEDVPPSTPTVAETGDGQRDTDLSTENAPPPPPVTESGGDQHDTGPTSENGPPQDTEDTEHPRAERDAEQSGERDEDSGAPVPGAGDPARAAETTTSDTAEDTPAPTRSTDADAPAAPPAAGPERAADSGSDTPAKTRTDPAVSGIDPRADARAASVLDRLPELTRALADKDIPRARALGAEFWRSLRPVDGPAPENRSIREAHTLAQALVYVLSDPSDRRVPLSGESIPPERVRDAETLARGIDRHLRDRHDPVRARLWLPGGRLTTDYVRYAMQDPADRGPSPYGAPAPVTTVNTALVDGDGDAPAPQGRSGESSTPDRTATDNNDPAASGSGTVRRLPTGAETDRYGTLLHDPAYNPNAFDALPTATQDAVSAYTWSAWLNDFARLHPLNEATVQAELDRIREESRSHPGWQVYEIGGGRWPDLTQLREAAQRGGLSPEQQRIVRGVLDNRYPEAALENLRVHSGRAGEIAESLALGGEPAHFPDAPEVLALFRRLDRATGHPFPEGFEAVRGTYEYQHLLGEGNTDPYTLAGTTHVSPGYFSASLGTVPSAAGGSPVDLMRLTVPHGSHGLWVGDRSQHPGEREVILARGTRYQITAVEPWGRGYLFHAQILPPAHDDGPTTTAPAWTGQALERIDQALNANDTAAALTGIRQAAQRLTADLASTLRDADGPDRTATIDRLEGLRDAAEHLADRAGEIADTAPEAVTAAVALAADLAAAAQSVAARAGADAAAARDAIPEPSEVDPENPDRITDAARERDTALTRAGEADTARQDAERAAHIAYEAADTAARTAGDGARVEEARAAAQSADAHRRDATAAAQDAADRHESLSRTVNVAANIAVGIALGDAASSRGDAAARAAALDRARSIAELTPPGSVARARLDMRMNMPGFSGPFGSNNPFAFAVTDIAGQVRDPDGEGAGMSGADLDSLAHGLGLTGTDDTESARSEAPGPATGTPPSAPAERKPGADPAADPLPDTFHSTLDTQTPPGRSGPVTGEESSDPGAAPSPRPVPTQSAPEPNTSDETTEDAPAENGVSRERATPPGPLTTGTGDTTAEAVRPSAPPGAETRVPTEETRTRSGEHEEGAPPPPAPTENDGTEPKPSVRPVDTDVTNTEHAPPPSPQHEHDTTADPVETVDATGTEQPAPPQQENTGIAADTTNPEDTEQPPPSPQENTDTTNTEDTEQPPPPQQENTGTTADTTNPEDAERTPPPPPPEDPRTTTDGTETERPQTDTGDTRRREEPPPRDYPGSVRPERTGTSYDLGYLLTSNLVNSSMIHAEHLRSFVDDTLANDAGHVDATVRDTVREQIDAQAREQTGVFFQPEGFSTTVNGADGSRWQARLRLNPSREGFHHAPTQPKEGSGPTDLKLVDEAGEANPAEGSGSHGGTKFIGMGFQVSPLLLGTVGGADIGPRFTFSFSGGTRQRQSVDTAVSLHDGYSSYEIKGKPEIYASDLTMSFELTPVHVPQTRAPGSGTAQANRNVPVDGTAPNTTTDNNNVPADNTAPNDNAPNGDAPANGTTPPDRAVNARAESANGVVLVLPGAVAANTGPETIRLRDPFATQDHQRGRNDDDRPVGPHADKGHPVSVGDIRLSDGSSDRSFPDWIADHLWSPEQDRGWWKSAVDKVTPGFVDRRRQQKLEAFHDQVGGTFSKKSIRNNLPEMTSGPAVFTVTDPSGRPRLVSIQSVPTAYDVKPHTIQPAKYIKGNKAERESGSSVRHSDFLGGTLGAGVSVDAGAVGGTHRARVDAIAVEGGLRGRSTAESSQLSSGAVNRMNYGKTESSAYDVQRNYYVHFDGETEVYRFQGDTVEILTVQEARILNGDEPSDKVPAPPAPVRTEGSGTAPEAVNPPGTVPDTTGNQQTGTDGNRQTDTTGDQQTGTDGNRETGTDRSRNAPDGDDRNADTGTEERGRQRENAPEQERPPGQQPTEERPDGEGRPEALRPPRPNLAEENPVTFHGAVPRDFTWPDGSQYRDVGGQQRSIYQHIAHQVLTGLADKLPGIVLPDMARDPKNFARRPGHENSGPFTGSTREHRPFRRDHEVAVFNTHRIIDAIAASEFKSGTDGLTLHGQPVHLIDTGRFDPSALFKSGQRVMRSPFVAVRVSADFSSLRHAGETTRGTGGEYAGSSEIGTADGSQKRKTVRFSSGGYIRRIDAVDAAGNPSDGGVFSVSLQLSDTKGKSRGLGMRSQSERTVQYAEDSSVWNSGVRFKARLYQDDDLGMVLGGDTPLAERGQDLLSRPIEAMATMDTAKAVPGGERGGRDETAPAPRVTRIRPIPVDQAQEMIDGPTRPTPDRVRKTRDLTGGVKRLFGGERSQRPPAEESTAPAPGSGTARTTGQQNTNGQQNTGSQTGDGQRTPAPNTNTNTNTNTNQPNTETAQDTTGQQNTETAADTTGQQDTGSQNDGVRTPTATETSGDVRTPPATETTGDTTGQQNTDTVPAPDTETAQTTTGQRNPAENAPDTRPIGQRRAEKLRDTPTTVENVNTRFTTGDGNRVSSLLEATYESFSSIAPWERDTGGQRPSRGLGFERKLRHFLRRGEGSRRFYENALSPENLADNPAVRSSGGARTRTETSGGPLSPMHLRTTSSTRFDIDSVDRFEQSDGAVVFKSKNTLETFSRDGRRTDLTFLATGGGRVNPNPIQPAEQPAGGTAPAPNSASAPLIQLGPSAGKSLFDRYTITKPTSRFNESVEFHPKIPMSYSYSASGRITQALEFVKSWSIGPTFPRSARYRGWQADSDNLETGLIHIRDAHASGMVEDKVEEVDGELVRTPQPEPEAPGSVKPRPGFEDSGMMLDPVNPDEAIQSLVDDLASQGWQLTKGSREIILKALDSHTGLNPNTGVPVTLKISPIDHSIGNLNAPTTAPLSLDATVKLRLDRSNAKVEYLGGKTEYRQRQGSEEGDRLQQGNESSAFQGAHGSLLTPLPQSGGDQPGGTTPPSRPYLMGLQGDGTTTNARGGGGVVRDTDKRSTQLTMETPYARVSSDTQLTLDLHISEKQGTANSLLGETPGSRTRDFTGTGNSGRAQELYPAFSLDLRNEASTTGGNDTPRTSTDGNENPSTTPEGGDTTRTTTDGNNTPRTTPEAADTTRTTDRGDNDRQPGGQRTGNRTAPENPSNDNHASLTDMARSLTRDMDPRTRDAFNDAVTLLESVENKGKDILDLGRIVLAKSLGWNPPANAVADGHYTPQAVEKAADYAADKLKLNSRNNAIDHALTELGIKASFAEASSEKGAELPELGPTTWMMRAIPHPETALIKDYNPSVRLTDSSETSRTFSPFHNESSTTTMGFEARPSGRTGTGPPTTATHYGSASNTGSSTSGGDTARGSRPKEPPHSDRVRTGPGYLVEMDTDVFIGARTELSGPWYKRSARYVGDKAASAGRAVRGAFGGRRTPSPVPTRPARWQQGRTTVKTTRWISHGDAVRMGVITPDHATRIAPLTERFARIQKALGDAEKAYLEARWPLDQAASDRVAAPDDPRVRQRYEDLEGAYEDRRQEFEGAVRDWVTALQELRDGLGDPSSLPRPRTATAPDLDTIQEEPTPPPAPQQNADDPAADPEAIELPERNNRQPGQEGRRPERGDTAPNLLDTLGSDLSIRPREAVPGEAPPQTQQRNTPDPATTESPERDDRPQEDVPRRVPEPSPAEVLERARQRLARDMVMGRALQGQEGSSRNGTAPTDNRPERHSRNQTKGPLSHTDQRSGPSSETHARPGSATVRRPRTWTTPTGEDGNGPSQHDAALSGDQAGTGRGPAPERVDDPADGYTANDEENLYDATDQESSDEEEAPRVRWLDRHYPEAASLSEEERAELMRSLMERSMAVGPPVPEGFRYDMDLGGPVDAAWLETQGAQGFPWESDTTALPGPSTIPSAPQQQDRPLDDQDQRPQPAPSEDDALARAAEDAVSTFDGQRLPLHTRTGTDHDTLPQPDQDTLSEASSVDSETLRDMRLRLERLMSSDPAPSEGDRPAPEDTGLTGDHGPQPSPAQTEPQGLEDWLRTRRDQDGQQPLSAEAPQSVIHVSQLNRHPEAASTDPGDERAPQPPEIDPAPEEQRSPNQTGTNPASEDRPALRRPQPRVLRVPSANPDRNEWNNRLQAIQDWRTNWEHEARTPEERQRLREDWRAKWSLPATTRPSENGTSQDDAGPTNGHGPQRSPGQTEADRAPGNRPVPQTETAPAGEGPRSSTPAETDPVPDSPQQSQTTTQPTRPSPEEASSPQPQRAPEQAPVPQPLTRNRDDEGSSTLPQERTDTSRQEGSVPSAEQAPPAADPASDLFAFFEQELNGPANTGGGVPAQDTAHAPSGGGTTTRPAPAVNEGRAQETSAPGTAPEATGSDPSRRQPEPEDGETAKEPEHTQDEEKKKEGTEEENEDAPTDSKDQRKDEGGDDGGPDKDGSGGNSGDRTGGNGGSGQDRSGGEGDQGGSGGSGRTGEGDRSGDSSGDRSGDRDGSGGKDRGKQGEDRSPRGGHQGGTNRGRGESPARPDTDADPVPDLVPDTDSDGYDSDDDLSLYDLPDTPVQRPRGSTFDEPLVRPQSDQDGSPSDSVDPKSSDKENGSPDTLGSKPFPDDFLSLLNPKADFDQPLPGSVTDILAFPVMGDNGGPSNRQPGQDDSGQDDSRTGAEGSGQEKSDQWKPATEVFGIQGEETEGDPAFPKYLTDGRILGRIPEADRTTDQDGLITHVKDKPLDEFVHELVNMRAREISYLVKNKVPVRVEWHDLGRMDKNLPKKSRPNLDPETGRNTDGYPHEEDGEEYFVKIPLTPEDLGHENGAVNSVVVDRRTGLVAEGLNGRPRHSVIAPELLHPEIKNRIDGMFLRGKYEILQKDGTTRRISNYPHYDKPARHAEVKAVNRLLNATEDAQISHFQLDNKFTLKPPWVPYCPSCANCARITEGAAAPRSGKNTHTTDDIRNITYYTPRRADAEIDPDRGIEHGFPTYDTPFGGPHDPDDRKRKPGEDDGLHREGDDKRQR
ncbi:hypothetical protein A9R04_09780 [Nocardiopsis dassonvillei]|uniref:ADP-ribosyltransferase n=1 Tax=Nocardiopsis dassonvillei TaxID=2014 RepID=UPI0008FCDBD2|nr:ADP-ribosyltransferase [Nocardiopsis dassonvillei]APC34958.1 hypothetical protein A9R04_09780 [Nocardiopsis dassonvillei]